MLGALSCADRRQAPLRQLSGPTFESQRLALTAETVRLRRHSRAAWRSAHPVETGNNDVGLRNAARIRCSAVLPAANRGGASSGSPGRRRSCAKKTAVRSFVSVGAGRLLWRFGPAPFSAEKSRARGTRRPIPEGRLRSENGTRTLRAQRGCHRADARRGILTAMATRFRQAHKEGQR
jgi:hypothetical protein